MAQEHDLQNDALRQDLLSFEAMEQHLIKDLKGETLSSSADNDPYRSVATADTGQYMTKERIDAWARIMLHDRQQSGLFITTSRAVIEHLLDEAPEARILQNIDKLTALENEIEKKENRHNRLSQHLQTIAADASSAATKTTTDPAIFTEKNSKKGFIFYIIPGLSPHQFFSRYMESTGRRSQDKKSTESVKNTLIGWYDG